MSGSQSKITNFFLCQSSAAANKAPSTVAESTTKPAPRRSKLSLKHKNVAAIANDRGKRLKPDLARCPNGSDLKERAPQDSCQASASAESVPECCTAQVLLGGTSGTENSPVVAPAEITVLETDSAERAVTEPRVPYYLENLVLIVNSVMNSDDWRLFSDEEKQMFATFLDADEKCQKLLARLLQRKHVWRKASKITYPDIAENLESVLLALQEKGYLEDVAHLNDLATAMTLLSPMETKSLAQMFRLKTTGRGKGNLAESLLEHCSKQQSVLVGSPRNTLEQLALKKALSLLGAAWRLRHEPRDAWRRLLRLFSLGTPWDGEEAGETPQVYGLQLVSAGKMAFPEYKVWRKDILFAEREDLIRYETARVLESQLMQAALDKKWVKARELLDNVEALARTPDSVQCGKRDQALAPFLRRFTTTGVYTRCRCLGVDVLQRLKEHRRAVRLLRALLGQTHFCLSRRGHWWDRLALNLDVHLGKPGEAMDAIKEALGESGISPASRHALLTRAARLAVKLPKHPSASALRAFVPSDVTATPEVTIEGQLAERMVPGRTNMFAVRESDGALRVIPVEEVALRHYSEKGYPQGIHGEGSTFHALFGILCWDAIYADGVPDAFRSPYQAFPMDLHSDGFFASREQRFLEVFENIRKNSVEELAEQVASTYDSHSGQAGLVQWERFSSVQIQELVRCFGPEVLWRLCNLLARNFRHRRSGLPDLVVWNPVDGRLKAAEVKGPGDTLSAKQVVWLRELLALGVDCEVCHVTGELRWFP